MARHYSDEEKELIGEFFLRLGILTANEVEHILEWQKKNPSKRFGEIGIEKGLLSEEELKKYLKEHRN